MGSIRWPFDVFLMLNSSAKQEPVVKVKAPRIYCKALQVREEKADFALLVKKAGSYL